MGLSDAPKSDEEKNQILFIVSMHERFCIWSDWHANLTSFFFIYITDKCLHTEPVKYTSYVWEKMSQPSWESEKCTRSLSEIKPRNVIEPQFCCCLDEFDTILNVIKA